MPLKLVLGPANSAKAGEVLGAYTGAARRGALLVVPTSLDAAHYARELAGRGTVLGTVQRFAGLVELIATRTGYVATRLSNLQRERVLRRVVASLSLRTMHEAAQSRGFGAAAGALIAELERALVTPQRLTAAMRAWGEQDPRRADYAADVAELYGAYRRELDRIGRVDRDLYAWRALDALRADPRAWGLTPVYFYGFDDFSGVERDAIEALSRVARAEVTVSLTYEVGREALSARAEVVEELRVLADAVQELPALDEHYAPASRRHLHHVERSLFEAGPEPIESGDAVTLLEGGGERAEAELVAEEIAAMMRDGLPPSEIVVVSRSVRSRAPLFERVLSEYGIPVTGDARPRFAHTALGRSILGLLRCAAYRERAGAQDLLAYLRYPGLVQLPELVDRLETEARREALLRAGDLRERFGWELGEIEALRDAEDPLEELARQARRLQAAPRRGCGEQLERRDELDARALAALLRALDQLRELGERPRLAELDELLEELELPEVPWRPGERVLLAEPLAIRARRFRAVIVCGLNEGEFPLPGSTDPFLSDERRRELAQASGLRLAAVEDAAARERYLFYACISRATQRLVLSYRSSDEEGNIALRSPFIEDVGALLEKDWISSPRRRLLAEVTLPPGRAGAAFEPLAEPRRALSDAALAEVRHTRVVSGGALERFADCPVRWLVEGELAPSRFEPDPEPLARGSYMHAVLEEVIGRLDGPVRPDSLPDALRILDEVIAEMPETLAPGRPHEIRVAALRSIEADLRRYLVHEAADESPFAPRALELRFGFEGEEGSLPPLVLGEDVRVRGVIDRIDVDAAGHAVVRDYKSGGARAAYQRGHWRDDRQLQVALYMAAVRDLLELDPVAGLYQPLGGSDLRARGAVLKGADVGRKLFAGDGCERDELDELLRDASDRAVELAARLRTGELKPCPETCSRDGCAYPGICRST